MGRPPPPPPRNSSGTSPASPATRDRDGWSARPAAAARAAAAAGGPAPPACASLPRTRRAAGANVRRRKAQAAQDGLGLALQPIAAQRLEAVLQVPVARGEGLVGRLGQRVRPTCSISRSMAQTSAKPPSASSMTEPAPRRPPPGAGTRSSRSRGRSHLALVETPPGRPGPGRAWSCRPRWGPPDRRAPPAVSRQEERERAHGRRSSSPRPRSGSPLPQGTANSSVTPWSAHARGRS